MMKYIVVIVVVIVDHLTFSLVVNSSESITDPLSKSLFDDETIQPVSHRHEPRRILPAHAHLKAESHVFLFVNPNLLLSFLLIYLGPI
jgi:hypothetical protein